MLFDGYELSVLVGQAIAGGAAAAQNVCRCPACPASSRLGFPGQGLMWHVHKVLVSSAGGVAFPTFLLPTLLSSVTFGLQIELDVDGRSVGYDNCIPAGDYGYFDGFLLHGTLIAIPGPQQ